MITVYHIVLPESTKPGAAPSPPKKKTKHEAYSTRRFRLTSENVAAGIVQLLTSFSGLRVPATYDLFVADDGNSASFCFVASVLGSTCTSIGRLDYVDEAAERAARTLPRTLRLVVDGEAVTAFGQIVSRFPEKPSQPVMPRKVLVVGAGGIGCELLKVAALRGFRDFVVVDLDTIDATNLNRQFLFRSEDVGHSKAATARKAILSIFDGSVPPPSIVALQANIKDAEFGVEYMKQFALVMNGLDNTSARKHVNRLCMQANVPLIESGTMGYNGQVQPIRRGVSECYDCRPKSSEQKTFAVCTIHAHPSTMVHCTHFAKEFYGRLFGDAVGADEFAFVDGIPPATLTTVDGASELFTLLFQDKVSQLLALRQTWPSRPPIPLQAEQLLRVVGQKSVGRVDQHSVLPLETLAVLFVDGVMRCASRSRVPFRKDDPLATVVVAAVANLRAACFHIDNQSISDVVTIAGSIVPAIATTNAIIAASVVAQGECILNSKPSYFLYVRKAPQTRRRHVGGSTDIVREKLLVHVCDVSLPNERCVVCSQANPVLHVELNVDLHTLGSLVDHVLAKQMALSAPFVNQGPTILFEHDEMENLRNEPLRRWVPNDQQEFAVGCMNQSVEWTMTIQHTSRYLDVSHFSFNGTDSASAEEVEILLRQQAAHFRTEEAVDTADQLPGGDSDDVSVYHPARNQRQAKYDRMTSQSAVQPTEYVEIQEDDETT